MGPKKKKGGNPVIDGVDTSAMTREQLEKFAHNLRSEVEREREERNYFQLERDKLRTFWEITREQLEDARLQLRSKEREIEVCQELAEHDIKHTNQQMKHVQYENQTRIGELRAEAMTQLKLAQEDHGLQEMELLNDKRELRRQLRERDEWTELKMQQLKMTHSEEMSQERARFEREANEMTQLHHQKLQEYIDESEIRHHMEMSEVEERKSGQIQRLIEAHDRSFSDMKKYYNDITLNNLALIASLKEQMEQLRHESSKTERLMAKVSQENRQLAEPMKEAQIELSQLRDQLQHYVKNKQALSRSKSRYNQSVKNVNDIKWETETLRMRCEVLTEERADLKKRYEESVMDIQQKSSLRTVILERKLSALKTESERREAMLSEVMQAAGIDSHDLNRKLQSLIETKNKKIEELRYELARVCKAHDDLLTTYEAKLMKFGIPKEELGFEPLRTVGNMKLGTGPAGLVAKKF